jgi:hypothetical protein
MKKLVFIFALLVVGVSLGACVDLTSVESIELNWTPAIEYALDDEVLLDDKEVTINFEDGGGNPLVVTIDSNDIEKLSGIRESSGSYYLDTSALGTFTLKIGYQGSTISIQYRVVPGDPTPSTVNTDSELRTLVTNATDTIVATLGANITLTGNLTSSHLLSIDTTVNYELDLGGFNINVNVPAGEDDYLDNSFAFTGSFVNGFVNVSSVFENTPNVGYLFTNSAVANEAVFDSVVVPLGTAQASLQALIDDTDVEVLLLEAGTYTLTDEIAVGPKDHALFIKTKTIIIGSTDSMGDPNTIITAGNLLPTHYKAVAILIGGTEDIQIHNVQLSGYDNMYEKGPVDGYQYDTSHEAAVLYSLGSVHGEDEFTGILTLDNLIFEEFMKNAMTFYGGTIYLMNSIIDGSDKNDKDVHVVNGIQASVDAIMYVHNNFFDSFSSIYPEDFPHDKYSSVATLIVYGGIIAELYDNIITNSDNGFMIDNYWRADFHPPYQSKLCEVYEDFTSGNTLFGNYINLRISFGVNGGEAYFGYDVSFLDMVNAANNYPLFDDYENKFYTSFTVYEDLHIDESVTLEQGYMTLWESNLTFDDDVILTLGDHAEIWAWLGSTFPDENVDYFAWYYPYTGYTNYIKYVGSIDQIEEGTEYTTSEGVTYTK